MTIDLSGGATASVTQDVVTNVEGYLGALSHANTFSGDSNGNYFIGGGQGDLIQGLDGADYLVGLGGDDTIEGGNGSDVIDGGAGLDFLFGGSGVDAFQIILGSDTDVVMDWVETAPDADIFLVRGSGLSFGDLTGNFMDHGVGDVVGGHTIASATAASFVVGSGADQTTVVVEGATAAGLDDVSNFVFL